MKLQNVKHHEHKLEGQPHLKPDPKKKPIQHEAYTKKHNIAPHVLEIAFSLTELMVNSGQFAKFDGQKATVLSLFEQAVSTVKATQAED